VKPFTDIVDATGGNAMAEPKDDANRRRFAEVLAKKKEKDAKRSGEASEHQAGGGQLPGSKSSRTFRRRKV
jgi:hypothetical protein